MGCIRDSEGEKLEKFYEDESIDSCQNIWEGIDYLMEKHIGKIGHLFFIL